MKKIGKKFSYLTKVFLVLGLLFSNLSGLSVVFAYENEDNFKVDVVNDKIIVNYLSELEDTDVISVEVLENYTYLDNTYESVIDNTYQTLGSVVKDSLGFSIDSSMLEMVKFDGLYELKVSLYNDTDDMDLGSLLYSYNVSHESGLSFSVYDADTMEEISLTDEKYYVSGDIKVYSNILSGGLNPTDIYEFDNIEYTGRELIDLSFESDRTFDGLYGEYNDTLSVLLLDNNKEEMTLSSDISYVYGEYSDNADVMNMGMEYLGLSDRYQFFMDSKDGYMYVYPNEKYSVNDLFSFLDLAVADTSVQYAISNSEYDDLELSYLEYVDSVDTSLGESVLSREEYFENVYVDNSTVIKLRDLGIEISFKSVILGDMNNDLVINEEDIQVLIEQIVSENTDKIENGDLYRDNKLDTMDVINLYQIYKDGNWNLSLEESASSIESMMEISSLEIVSGDEFDVYYTLNLGDNGVNGIAGRISYDEDMLELVGITTENEWLGNSKDGRFLYLGEELKNDNFVVLKATFKANKAGASEISIDDLELFDNNIYYQTADMTNSISLVVNTSSDNTLSSLTVAGESIVLEDGVMDYEITVENDTTELDLEAIVNNVAASISSIVAPEQLAVGENEITIIVKAENGDELIYTIKVIRKDAPKEETPSNMNYTNDNGSNEIDDKPIINDEPNNNPSSDKKDDDKDSSLSRIIIIILILLVIAGLIYLIFKDDNDDEGKKTNKNINKIKKSDDFTVSNKKKGNSNKNNKKER